MKKQTTPYHRQAPSLSQRSTLYKVTWSARHGLRHKSRTKSPRNIKIRSNGTSFKVKRSSSPHLLMLRLKVNNIYQMVEHDSVIWSHFTVKDIRPLSLFNGVSQSDYLVSFCFTYHGRLKRITSLELRSFYFDLIWCYKILLKHVNLEFDDFFEWAFHPGTRGHRFKLEERYACISCSHFSASEL